MSRMARSIKIDRPHERGEEREAVSLGEDSAFNLPKHFLEKYPDKSFCFIPYLCGGVELTDDYYDAIYKRKFEPVLSTSFPELCRRMPNSPFAKKEDDNLIKVKGQAVMMRSVEDKKAEDDKYNEYNARQEYLINLHRQNPQNPALFVDERRWVSAG